MGGLCIFSSMYLYSFGFDKHKYKVSKIPYLTEKHFKWFEIKNIIFLFKEIPDVVHLLENCYWNITPACSTDEYC